MFRKISFMTLALVGLSSAYSFAQQGPPATLKVGDAAPALSVGKWIKGEPVAKIEAGKVYVVEFWATWCGPCRETIPHITELAKKYPDVVFIGQDVWEEDESEVKPFVDQMGDKMNYRVATDSKVGQDGDMSKNWMRAAGKNSIPTAFVIDKESKIAWIGHPMEMAPVLEKVVAGTYDVKSAAAEQEKMEALNKRINTAARANDVDGVLSATKELVALRPDMATPVSVFEFKILSKANRTDEARTRAADIAAKASHPAMLNDVAWTIATRPSPAAEDLTIARQAIDRALEMTQSRIPALLDTSARLYAVNKDWTKATETETKAVELANGEMKADLQKSLDAYKKQELPSAQ